MNHAHAFRFVTLITATLEEFARRSSSEQEKYGAAFLDVLERFVAVHPGPVSEADSNSAYARLSATPIPARLREFEVWLAGKGEGEAPQGPEWACWRLARAYPYVANPSPYNNRPFAPKYTSVLPTASQALAAARQLGKTSAPQVRAVLEAAIDAWYSQIYMYADLTTCVDCGSALVHDLFESEHLVACQSHPALTRLAGVELAARVGAPLFGEIETASGRISAAAAKVTVRRPVFNIYEAKDSVELLFGAKAHTASEKELAEARLRLETVCLAWAHYLDRSTDPCPWCAAVLPSEQMLNHLRSCVAHPANAEAERLTARLAARWGQVALPFIELVTEAAALRAEVSLLLEACTRFDEGMGWTGNAGYSDKWTEQPWRAAVAKAQKLAGLYRLKCSTPTGSPTEVRAALEALLSDPEGGLPPEVARKAIARLTAAAAELDAWVAKFGRYSSCPACHRPGVATSQLSAHLASCIAHPAVRRARRLSSALRLEAPLQVIDSTQPREFGESFSKYLRELRDTALKELFEFEAPEVSKKSREEAERFVLEWEQMWAVASQRCPWCGVTLEGDHLLRCAAHPAAVAGQKLVGSFDGLSSPARDAIVALRDEADVLRLGLARLVDACNAFWNGMSDGDNGKSVSNPEIEKMLSLARAEVSKLQV